MRRVLAGLAGLLLAISAFFVSAPSALAARSDLRSEVVSFRDDYSPGHDHHPHLGASSLSRARLWPRDPLSGCGRQARQGVGRRDGHYAQGRQSHLGGTGCRPPRSPGIAEIIPPGPSNPLGPRALVLAADEYAIHGTNRPDSIGTKASYGCIRMFNHTISSISSPGSASARLSSSSNDHV